MFLCAMCILLHFLFLFKLCFWFSWCTDYNLSECEYVACKIMHLINTLVNSVQNKCTVCFVGEKSEEYHREVSLWGKGQDKWTLEIIVLVGQISIKIKKMYLTFWWWKNIVFPVTGLLFLTKILGLRVTELSGSMQKSVFNICHAGDH